MYKHEGGAAVATIRLGCKKHQRSLVAIGVAILVMAVVLTVIFAGTASACPPDKGEVEFQKSALGSEWPAGTQRSDFSITLTPVDGGDPVSHMLASNGKYMFTENPGTYNVSETGPTGVSFTNNLPATVTLVAGQKQTISFSNTYTPPPQLYDLCLHKLFGDGYPLALSNPELYKIQLVCVARGYDSGAIPYNATGDVCFAGLLPGLYTWTETGPEGVAFTATCSLGNPISIGTGSTIACVPEEPKPAVVSGTITNTYVPRLGEIVLRKNLVAGDWPVGITAASFTAIYKYNGETVKVPFELVDEASPLVGRAILQIPEEFFGLYEFIGEEGPNGVDYNVVINPGSVTVDAQNLKQEVAFTNTYKPPLTTTTEEPTTTSEAPTTTTLGSTTTTGYLYTTTTVLKDDDRDEYPYTGFEILAGLGAFAVLGCGGVVLRRLTSRKQ